MSFFFCFWLMYDLVAPLFYRVQGVVSRFYLDFTTFVKYNVSDF